MTKVNLDALILREDFEVPTVPNYNTDREAGTISLAQLKETERVFSILRKPDFQRETSAWSADLIISLVGSALDGEFIPSVILWKGNGTPTFRTS